MPELHPIQIQILKKLLFNPKLRYTDLRPSEEIENNKLNFHLNQLQEQGFITKDSQFYSLTNSGKEFAGRLDTQNLQVKKQAKISASICPVRNTGKETEYLIYTRLKAPFYGCQGFMSGKVDYGEHVSVGAARELFEETNLKGEVRIVALKHYKVFDKTSKALLEDKFMFFCIVENPTGELIPSDEGKYEWVAESKLKDYITNHFESWEGFQAQLEMIKHRGKNIEFVEEDHYSEKF